MGHLNMDSPQAIRGGAGSPASSPAWQGAFPAFSPREATKGLVWLQPRRPHRLTRPYTPLLHPQPTSIANCPHRNCMPCRPA